MVRAIVGTNWGDEGKGKITDMLAKESGILSSVFRVEAMRAIQLSTTMADSRFICFRPAYFMIIRQALSATELL